MGLTSKLGLQPLESPSLVAERKGSLDIGYAQVSEEFYLRGEAKVRRALDIYEEWFMHETDLDQYYINIEL